MQTTYRPPVQRLPSSSARPAPASAPQQQQQSQPRSRSPWGSLASTQVVNGGGKGSSASGMHPLKNDWIVYYVHRPPGSKVIEYEKEIKRIGSFGSIESFWGIYYHLLPPSSLPPVTDLLLFASTISRPVWEELPDGGKWVIRLRKGVADRLWESTLLTLISDQFPPSSGLVGAVLSVRSQEDILSVWGESEEKGGGEMSGVKDKLIELLKLPEGTIIEYKSNKSLLESATHKAAASSGAHGAGGGEEETHAHHGHGGANGREGWGGGRGYGRGGGAGGRKVGL